MQISYNWLQEYLPVKVEINELSEILTAIGLEVEAVTAIEKIKGGLKGVVVGEVVECAQHPNADKLKITKVNIGEAELLDIVCGAPNVALGQKVLVATIGTQLFPIGADAPFDIKPAKIRGTASQGMICAEDELGIGTSHDGIMILPADTMIGMSAKEYFQLGDAKMMIEIGLTPNRSDAMSHLGVARDVCTYLTHHRGEQIQVLFPSATLPNKSGDLPIYIEVIDTDKCPRYAGLVIENVKVQESPEWLKIKLQTIGQKPINNVVDITNFVLHEYGQPLHAFDYDSIACQQIVVKTLTEGTEFITLDKKERKLSEEDLMITDVEAGLCIAGVMGGTHTGVAAQTTNIFLESAFFDPKSIRRTSMRHQLRTDAATHFEKTVNIDNVLPALHRAAVLIMEIAGGNIASDIIDLYPNPLPHKEVTFRYDYIGLLCGKTYAPASVNGILLSMGFEILTQDDKQCTVKVPFSKSDINQAADIAEEILRIDGLNNVAISNTISFSLPKTTQATKRIWKEKICQWLTNQGLSEILTNSIINDKDYASENIVKMINSLSADLNAMRPAMMKSGLDVLEFNINRGMKNAMIYEWGNVYSMREVGQYFQEEKLAIWTTGNRQIANWQGGDVAQDIYYLKGMVEGMATVCGIQKLKIKTTDTSITYAIGKKEIASIQQVSAADLKKSGLKQNVFFAELKIAEWLQAITQNKTIFKEINKFPRVERDLSLVLDKTVTYAQIETATNKKPIPALQSFKLFDIFEGAKLGEDKRAWAINYIFQVEGKTLTDAEVDAMMATLMSVYEGDLKADIRK